MKQKTNDNDDATKDFIKDVLQNYPTKADLRKELQNYPTKADLRKELKTAIEASETRTDIKMDKRFKKSEDKVATALIQLKSDIFAKIDSFLGEVENDRLDRQDLKNIVVDHEKRITKIERFQKAA